MRVKKGVRRCVCVSLCSSCPCLCCDSWSGASSVLGCKVAVEGWNVDCVGKSEEDVVCRRGEGRICLFCCGEEGVGEVRRGGGAGFAEEGPEGGSFPGAGGGGIDGVVDMVIR